MTNALKLLFSALLFSILTIGNGQRCDLSSLQINTKNTGNKVGLDFLFEVEVKNQCGCTVTNVFLDSNGFISSVQVDPKVFRSVGTHYLINDGNGIPSSGSFRFSYAWDHWWRLSPASLHVTC